MRDSLSELQALAAAFVDERDWGQFHSPRNLAMAVSVEANELLELYLWSDDEGPQPRTPKQQAEVAGEVADIMICLMNFSRQANIDLESAVRAKLLVAAEKYPAELVKGKALKYDEY